MNDHSGQYFGRYYLIERLGEGGMAVVYKAHDTRLDRDVAIKIIRTGAFPSDDLGAMLKRFEREAKSLARLSHPNIVKVYDFGEHEGSPYLVMEYLPGGTWKRLIGRPVPWQEAIKQILPVARGVAYAHRHGVLHRDIKPANVLITEDGEPMLSDFGIAKLFESDLTTELTRSGSVIGTPGYMAPEQWEGITSPQTDLYSLGIIFYEMLAGRKPYIADTPASIIKKQATEPLPRPGKFVSDLPEDLELVLLKSLAREPSDRYQDLNAFIAALEKIPASVPEPPAFVGEQGPVDETHGKPLPETVVASAAQVSALPLTRAAPAVEVAATKAGKGPTDGLVPTQVSPSPLESPIPFVEGTETRNVSIPSPRAPLKFSRKWAWVLAGGVTVLLAIWLGFPLIGQLGAPVPTATLTVTSSPVVKTPTAIPLPTEIKDRKGVSMVFIPVGEFTMGIDNAESDQSPAHKVFLDSYYIDKYEVTNAQYKACVKAEVCKLPVFTESYDNPEYESHPVVYVTWNMAQKYCEWRGSRLPTEAEWEKAARGTNGSTYGWGVLIGCTYANYLGCAGGTTPVGDYENSKSPYGTYDMVGNVYEWVADWYGKDYYSRSPRENPLGPITGPYRVFRGGSWRTDVRFMRPSYRSTGESIADFSTIGFRCARSP